MKRFTLYTFKESKLVYTDAKDLKTAINNFKNRINLDWNGYHHPQLEYLLSPMPMLTVDKATEDETKTEEKIIEFNVDELRQTLWA